MSYRSTFNGPEVAKLLGELADAGAEVVHQYAMQVYDTNGVPMRHMQGWHDTENEVRNLITEYRAQLAACGANRPVKIRILRRTVVVTQLTALLDV